MYLRLRSENEELISFKALNCFLEMFFDLKDVEKIVEILDLFLKRKHRPSVKLLSKIANAENLPDVLVVRLKSFPYQSKALESRNYGKNEKVREKQKQMGKVEDDLLMPLYEGSHNPFEPSSSLRTHNRWKNRNN